MFAALFVFVLVTVHAAEEIPSYIHVCGRNNPNYDQCFLDNVNNLKNKICTGMPEFNVPPNEPIIVKDIVIYNTDNLKLHLKGSKIRKFCDFIVNSIHTSPDKLHMEFDFVLKHFDMDSIYDFNIRVLVSLANEGLVHISQDNVKGKIIIDFKEETKNGKTEIYAFKVTTNFDIKTFNFEFDDSEKDLVQLHEILRKTVNENQKEIISIVKPVIEKTVSELGISTINKIVRNRYEQLFPNEA